MVYCKPFDDDVIHSFMLVYKFMQEQYPWIQIYVDDWVLKELEAQGPSITFPQVFVNDGEKSREQIDFIITLGGDGTILWASKEFRRQHFPPLISFSHGSLGYMCNFEFEEFP
jgi:NAD+ kinase